MDIFAALALATEPPLKSVIDGSPYKNNESLLSATVWRQILGISFYNVVILCLAMFMGRLAAGLPVYDRDTMTGINEPEDYEKRFTKMMRDYENEY